MASSMLLQHEIRRNAEEMHEYLRSMGSWVDEMNKKDEALKKKKKEKSKQLAATSQSLPPIRGHSADTTYDIPAKPLVEEVASSAPAKKTMPDAESSSKSTAKAIKPKTYQEYHEWDKFNPDKYLEEEEEAERAEEERKKLERDDMERRKKVEEEAKKARQEKERREAEEKKRVQEEAQKREEMEFQKKMEQEDKMAKDIQTKQKEKVSNDFKEKGNEFFKQGKYQQAIDMYSRCIEFTPQNAIAYANRAMALIKINKLSEAEKDCTQAINFDKSYVKAYQRRAHCYLSTGRPLEALEDCQQVLMLDPTNSQSLSDLKRAQEALVKTTSTLAPESVAQPQPKKKRIVIEEVEEGEKEISTSTSGSGLGLKSEKPEIKTQEVPKVEKKRIVIEEVENEKEKEEEVLELSTSGAKRLSSLPMEQRPQPPTPVAQKQQPTATPIPTAVPTAPTLVEKALPTETKAPTPTPTAAPAPAPPTEKPTAVVSPSTLVKSVPKESPRTLYEFERIYNSIKSDREALHVFVKTLDTTQIPRLFKDNMSPEVFSMIVSVIHEYCLSDGEHSDVPFAFNCMFGLSKIGRFSMSVMFLAAKEKKIVAEIFDKLAVRHSAPDQVPALRKLYRV